MIQNPVKVGRLLKTFGIDGQLRCQIDDRFIKLIKKNRYVWVEMDGLMVPLLVSKFVAQYKPLIYFADVSNERHAKILSGHWIFLNREDYPNEPWPAIKPEGTVYHFLIDFSVNFASHQTTGTITKIVQYPAQEIAFVQLTDPVEKELLVPLVEEFIMEIDEKKRIIYFNVPDGLLDL